jgi:hypothetical protein
MTAAPDPGPRLRRLGEELVESGLRQVGTDASWAMLVEEIDHALRPPVHERRIFSGGTVLDPTSDPATWASGTQLDIIRQPLGRQPLPAARRFADGLSSWVLRRTDGTTEWLVFDRPVGSERDLVVLASVLGATVVQRHPSGSVRVVGHFGVLRWEGLRWHHEPPVASWVDSVIDYGADNERKVLAAMLEFAVHDLTTRRSGARPLAPQRLIAQRKVLGSGVQCSKGPSRPCRLGGTSTACSSSALRGTISRAASLVEASTTKHAAPSL